jgi:glycosyltransferase involved in cell wall biosynthesis
MKAQRGFVCGFYGARDSYEVPVALHEEGLLDIFVTDVYGEARLLNTRGLLRATRQHEALPQSKVRGSAALFLAKRICGKMFADPERRNLWPDALLSRRIGREAEKRDAHIFTYEPYAVKRPAGGFPGGRKQIVFYYHPHVDTEDAIYREDQRRFPEFYHSTKVTESPWRRRTADAWKQADLVLCASSFTKQSLVAAGMPEERVVVVPYGTTGLRQQARGGGLGGGVQRSECGDRMSEKNGALKALFVGRNPLRKGLHHLLMAWNAAAKSPGDLLTIVCAARPPEIHRLAEGRRDVRWFSSVSGDELDKLYAESDALVVPSLCEGFGHVYLEAMSHQCAVVGTLNSGLPDLGGESEGVFTVEVGDIGGLGQLFARASSNSDLFRGCAEGAKRRAAQFTWVRFRHEVAAAAASVAA